VVQVEADAARAEVKVQGKVQVEVDAEVDVVRVEVKVQGKVVDRVWGVVAELLAQADNVSVRIAARLLPISRVCLVLT
jgi:hypothetical protein